MMLTVELISSASIDPCVEAVMFARVLAILLVSAILSVSFNSFINVVRFMA